MSPLPPKAVEVRVLGFDFDKREERELALMRRLTVVNIGLLPLTFLCGVYGMNFEYLPELRWQYGYPVFWLAVAAIVVAIAWVSKRARLL